MKCCRSGSSRNGWVFPHCFAGSLRVPFSELSARIVQQEAACVCASIAAITTGIECDERFVPAGRPLENFGMAERMHSIVVAGPPVLLHRAARELVVLGITLVALRAIDELHDVGGVTLHGRA